MHGEINFVLFAQVPSDMKQNLNGRVVHAFKSCQSWPMLNVLTMFLALGKIGHICHLYLIFLGVVGQ